MKFEVYGPYHTLADSIIKIEHAKIMKKEIDAVRLDALNACGCYIFGIKSSGGKESIPWYVGKAERQSVISEALNRPHLQIYNEILNEFERGIPSFYFIPAQTESGRPKAPTQGKGGVPAIDFLESWLISVCLKRNRYLWNIKKTKLLREVYVPGIFNKKPGALSEDVKSLKRSIGV